MFLQFPPQADCQTLNTTDKQRVDCRHVKTKHLIQIRSTVILIQFRTFLSKVQICLQTKSDIQLMTTKM